MSMISLMKKIGFVLLSVTTLGVGIAEAADIELRGFSVTGIASSTGPNTIQIPTKVTVRNSGTETLPEGWGISVVLRRADNSFIASVPLSGSFPGFGNMDSRGCVARNLVAGRSRSFEGTVRITRENIGRLHGSVLRYQVVLNSGPRVPGDLPDCRYIEETNTANNRGSTRVEIARGRW
jgi:hypothetical protein